MSAEGLYDIIDPRFEGKLISSARMEELHSGCRWLEGPVWFSDQDCLLFSDIPNQRMLRYLPADGSVSVFRQPSNFANGHTRDRQGRLVSCEHGTRRVTRTEPDGSITVIADAFEGKRLNSPNDVVVHTDGSIWFTDPSYGILSDYEGYRSPEEQDCRGVYRVDAKDGSISRVADDFVQPNGLAFSPDESKLYVADSGQRDDGSAPRHIRIFDVVDGAKLANGREFAVIEEGHPDGFRLDADGWIWCSAAGGVEVFDTEGTLVGKIRVPQRVSNLTFGGIRRNRLFITATSSLYALYVNARGAQVP